MQEVYELLNGCPTRDRITGEHHPLAREVHKRLDKLAALDHKTLRAVIARAEKVIGVANQRVGVRMFLWDKAMMLNR